MNDWLSLCKDQQCSGCGADDGTVVPAHANSQEFGKGMGHKADDWTVVPLCMTCHDRLDKSGEPREVKRAFWERCWNRHMKRLFRAGLVAPVGAKERERVYKRLPKILPRNVA